MAHQPVLLEEVTRLLDPKPGEIALDATVNRGGHARRLAAAIGPTGTLIGLDLDRAAIAAAEQVLKAFPLQRLILRQANFRDLETVFLELGLPIIHRALFDLGWSAEQLVESGRGFSFDRDEPLLMTLGETASGQLTANEIVNEWSETSLTDVIHGYGGERFARPIARAIVANRLIRPIQTTAELVKVVESAVPFWYRRRRLHPATKTFQALRIAVNDELGALTTVLPVVWRHLAIGGRLAVISFHELEARVVKNFFRLIARDDQARLVNKKAVQPTRQEILDNPRARSATLRVVEKVKNED